MVLQLLLCALLFFVSPQFGIAGYARLAFQTWSSVPVRRWPAVAFGSLFALMLFIGMWTLRNVVYMNQTIVLRSDLGLELALAFHVGALRGDEGAEFR